MGGIYVKQIRNTCYSTFFLLFILHFTLQGNFLKPGPAMGLYYEVIESLMGFKLTFLSLYNNDDA